MASGDYYEPDKIRTTEIAKELKQAKGDNANFFYLLVSTSGKEDKTQLNGQSSASQPTLIGGYNIESDSENDDTESEDDDDVQMDVLDATQNTLPPTTPPEAHNSKKKARKMAMNEVHCKILPQLLYRDHRWKKVYDKDLKSTYRALYFNIMERKPNEDEITHYRRVGEIRERICEAVKLVREQHNVNFKINSLLSKPILYDKPSPEEQSLMVA